MLEKKEEEQRFPECINQW